MLFKKNNRLSEANIQAEFYSVCKDNGIGVYLEYKHKNSRFDAVIHKGGFVKFIIEFKSYKTLKPPKYNTKQIAKYSKYNIPIILITRLEHIPAAIDQIKSNLY